MRSPLAFVTIAVLALACGTSTASPPPSTPASTPQGASQPAVSATPSQVSSATPTVEPPSPTAAVANAAPPELAGSWRTTTGERIVLSLIADRYSISRGPGSARGRIAVHGSEIELFGSDLCAGSGVYSWAIAGEVLTLTEIGARDPCSNRSDAVADRPFTRS